MLTGLLVLFALATAPPAPSADDVLLPKPITAEYLASIDQIPFGKIGAAASPEYQAILNQGLGIIPELAALLDNPTPTTKRVPLFGGFYAVGDIALSAISNIVMAVPWLEFITSPEDPRIKEIGFTVYYDYVRASPLNRVHFKKKFLEWFSQNENSLVWRSIPDIPTGGVYDLPTGRHDESDG